MNAARPRIQDLPQNTPSSVSRDRPQIHPNIDVEAAGHLRQNNIVDRASNARLLADQADSTAAVNTPTSEQVFERSQSRRLSQERASQQGRIENAERERLLQMQRHQLELEAQERENTLQMQRQQLEQEAQASLQIVKPTSQTIGSNHGTAIILNTQETRLPTGILSSWPISVSARRRS
jgi:hypothetical protein